ncbi:MAG: hypothetical protein AAF847_00230 [Bacteroidota bacterium]
MNNINKIRFTKFGEVETSEYGTKTQWWYDTARPIQDDIEGQPYVMVERYQGEDPNDFIKCENMTLLFTDHAEYYAVCQECHSMHMHQQWSGSTNRISNWREEANEYLEEHEEKKGWCEFCDPIFGNGGWRLDAYEAW